MMATPYERAEAAFEKAGKAKGATTRETVRTSECPTCGLPMVCTRTYTGESYRFVGVCSADGDHNITRFGYATYGDGE